VNKVSTTVIDAGAISQQRMQAISQVVKHVGHDFNNLFGIVIGTMGILEEELAERPGTSDLHDLIGDALSAGREGAALMSRLLACAGHQSLKPKPVDIAALLEIVEARFQSNLDPNIELKIADASNLPAAMADPEKLETALFNLLENSREAMPQGGAVQVLTEVVHCEKSNRDETPTPPPGEYLLVSISDFGEGIEPAMLERVYEPFVTTRQPAKNRGLGLSVAYGFAEQSRGALSLASVLGEGTTARLQIPTVSCGDKDSRP